MTRLKLDPVWDPLRGDPRFQALLAKYAERLPATALSDARQTDLWQCPKQRKLVQWALAYAAFAFALLQGVDIAYPPLPGNQKP